MATSPTVPRLNPLYAAAAAAEAAPASPAARARALSSPGAASGSAVSPAVAALLHASQSPVRPAAASRRSLAPAAATNPLLLQPAASPPRSPSSSSSSWAQPPFPADHPSATNPSSSSSSGGGGSDVFVVKLPDGTSALAVPPELADLYADETLAAAAAIASAPQGRGGGAAGANAAGGPGGFPPGAFAISPESQAMVTVALTSANSVAQLRELGFDLDLDGWLVLPTGERVFLPAYLAAQEHALRAARRAAVADRIRKPLAIAGRLARVVRTFSVVHLGMTVLQMLLGDFSAMLGFLATGGLLGARHGRSFAILLYLAYCGYTIGTSVWVFVFWARDVRERGSAVVFQSAASRVAVIIVGVVFTAAVLAAVASVALLVMLRRIYRDGFSVGRARTGGGYYAVQTRRVPDPPNAAAGPGLGAGGGGGGGGGGLRPLPRLLMGVGRGPAPPPVRPLSSGPNTPSPTPLFPPGVLSTRMLAAAQTNGDPTAPVGGLPAGGGRVAPSPFPAHAAPQQQGYAGGGAARPPSLSRSPLAFAPVPGGSLSASSSGGGGGGGSRRSLVSDLTQLPRPHSVEAGRPASSSM
jgi:hypothetical protein